MTDNNVKLNLGEMQLDKGNVRKDVKLFAWDAIRECSPSTCPVSSVCTYIKKGKCAVLVQYLRALYDSVLSNYKTLDDVSLFKVGMQIVPLYLQLAKMQLLEMSLDSPIYTTDKGANLAHPVYREIRETLKTIHLMWKDLDLSFSFANRPDPDGSSDKATSGDPNFYENIVGSGKSQKGIIR
jgi:hypothetical protein